MWQTVTREQLYEQVWSVPIWTLCQQYGLSDNGLRKICRRLNVPVPPRGYWAKVEAGHKVKKMPLPAKAERTTTEFWRAPKRERTAADDADMVWLKEREAFEADPANLIEVVERPRRWHAAIAPLKEGLEEEAKRIEASRKAHEQYEKWPEWRKQREMGPDRMAWLWCERAGQLMPATHHATVARLSLAQFRRGLAILNSVSVAAAKRQFEVTLNAKKGRLVLEGHGGQFELRMAEKTLAMTRKVKRYDGKLEDEPYRVPSGRLRIFVERGYGKVWTIEETAEGPLENKLNAFFAGLWKQVTYCRQKTREEEERERRAALLAAERAEVERKRLEEERIREEETRRRRALIEEAAAWRRAAEIRAYVGAVRAEAELRGDEAVASVAPWMEWALEVAREMDPVGQRERTDVAASLRGHAASPATLRSVLRGGPANSSLS
jgi:hypothetical protein